MAKRANDGEIMVKPMRKYTKKAYVPTRTYDTPGIPYQVSRPEPNQFWSIKKWANTPEYWKKRYWRRRITGRGTYRMDPEAPFGRRWGGYLGSKIGEWAGGLAHSAFTGLTGLGDYKVRRNVFLNGNLPQMSNQPSGGGTVIRFQEFLTDVYTSGTAGAFKIDSWVINAANPSTFPFLSQIAANYEQYELEGIVFAFQSRSSDALNSTNTALGSVMMATQYDTLDPLFNSKMEMLNYEFSTSCKPSENALHMVECDPRQTTINELYTLYNEVVPTGADPRLYYLGRFSLATTGFQGTNVNIGELRVTYQVRLLKPKLYTTLALEQAWFRGSNATQTFTNAQPLPFYSGSVVFGNMNVTWNQALDELYLPSINSTPVKYRIHFQWSGVAALIAAPTFGLTNCVYSGQQSSNMNGASSAIAIHIFNVTTTGIGIPTITIGSDGVLPTGGAGAQGFAIWVNRVNPNS